MFPLSRGFPLLLQSFRPFSLSFDGEKDWKYTVYPLNWTMYNFMLLSRWGVYRLHGNGNSPRVWPCIWSQITPNSKCSVNSQDKKTVECGNHYNVLFIIPKLKGLYVFNLYEDSLPSGRYNVWVESTSLIRFGWFLDTERKRINM